MSAGQGGGRGLLGGGGAWRGAGGWGQALDGARSARDGGGDRDGLARDGGGAGHAPPGAARAAAAGGVARGARPARRRAPPDQDGRSGAPGRARRRRGRAGSAHRAARARARRAGEGADTAMLAKDFSPRHFSLAVDGKIATVTLNRPERKNPPTFESYAELRDTFRSLCYVTDVKAVVITGAGGNFCSGGDVHEIIGPLVRMQESDDMQGLINFTRMTGDLVKAMRHCPQPIIAAIDGICAGGGGILAMASDLRLGTPRTKTAFLFVRVGLAGADMGACNMLPRIIGAGRAAELLYTGRAMDGAEAERWGFYNKICQPAELLAQAQALAKTLADGPTFANAMTKRCIHQEWSMGIDDSIEAEAQAQAICMQTRDYGRAYRAFVKKEKPQFEGN